MVIQDDSYITDIATCKEVSKLKVITFHCTGSIVCHSAVYTINNRDELGLVHKHKCLLMSQLDCLVK